MLRCAPHTWATFETCNYSHDDLSRIGSVSCNPGSTLLQTFTYDAFGNIAKNGTYNWLPTYNQSTNQIGGIAGGGLRCQRQLAER